MVLNAYWRLEWHDGDILTAPQKSTGWTPHNPTTADGLSAFHSLAELVGYFTAWEEDVRRMLCFEETAVDANIFFTRGEEPPEDFPSWAKNPETVADFLKELKDTKEKLHRVPKFNSRVVCLLGRRVGTCIDGHPLIQPMEILFETTWEDAKNCDSAPLLDGVADPKTIETLFSMTEGRPGSSYLDVQIGPYSAIMKDEKAIADWNSGNIVGLDGFVYAEIGGFHRRKSFWVPLEAASESGFFQIEGEMAEAKKSI